MDLGATCCTRSKPLCGHCPLQKKCQASKSGDPAQYPIKIKSHKIKPKRQTTMLVLTNEDKHILLQKRDLNGIWPGLYSLPEINIDENIHIACEASWPIHIKKLDKLDSFIHQFTHFNLVINPVICHTQPTKNRTKLNQKLDSMPYAWHAIDDALTLGIPAPIKKILQSLQHLP